MFACFEESPMRSVELCIIDDYNHQSEIVIEIFRSRKKQSRIKLKNENRFRKINIFMKRLDGRKFRRIKKKKGNIK